MNQRAVNVAVGGRYSLANWFDPQGRRREFACRTTRMNPFRMLISVPVVGRVGERIVSYFGDFGRLDGWIADTVNGGVLVDLEVDRALREKLARQLTWLEKKQKDGIKDARTDGRIVPKDPHSTIIFGDGDYRSCFIIDMSSSGAAISADVQPDIGTPLAVGACVGRVIRHFREGFAVKFIERQDGTALEYLVSRPMTWAAESISASNGQAHERVTLNV
jgi:hypothetical protein